MHNITFTREERIKMAQNTIEYFGKKYFNDPKIFEHKFCASDDLLMLGIAFREIHTSLEDFIECFIDEDLQYAVSNRFHRNGIETITQLRGIMEDGDLEGYRGFGVKYAGIVKTAWKRYLENVELDGRAS